MEKDWREVNKLYDKVLALHFPPGSKQGVVRRLQMGVADLIWEASTEMIINAAYEKVDWRQNSKSGEFILAWVQIVMKGRR